MVLDTFQLHLLLNRGKIMIRYIKNLGIYILVAIVLQIGVLYYINNKYLGGFSGSLEQTKSQTVAASTSENNVSKANGTNSGSVTDDNITKFNVPEEAKEIQLSKEADKLAYVVDGKLEVIYKSEKVSIDSDGLKLLKYQWFNEDSLILALAKENSTYVSFYKYDLSTKDKTLLSSLALKDKKSSIDSIISSPLKDLIFARVTSSTGSSDIYKLNVRNEFEKVALNESKIKEVYLIPHEDKLVYNSSLSNNVYVTYLENKLAFNQKGITRILGVDKSENVYVGITSGNSISKIFYGVISEKTSNWKSIILNIPIQVDDLNSIFVVNDTIYKVNREQNKLEDLNGNNNMTFEGTFITVSNGKILSRENGQVYIN
jgi:hypothetical protein